MSPTVRQGNSSLCDKANRTCVAQVLQYALTLEHLEASFYEEGMMNYTKQEFMDAGVDETAYNNLKMIAMDEKAHEKFLSQALTSASFEV